MPNDMLNILVLDAQGDIYCSLEVKTEKAGKPVARLSDIEEANLTGLCVKSAMFEFGNMDGSKFTSFIVEEVDFVGTWLCNIEIKDSKISNVLFYDAQVYEINASNSCFECVSFQGVNLSEAKFENCTFENCKFIEDKIAHKTDLSGAIFTDCTFKNCDFTGVTYDEDTVLPKKFRPIKNFTGESE